MITQHKNTTEIATVLFSLFVVITGYGVLLPVLPFFVERLALLPGINQQTINFILERLLPSILYFN